MYLRGFNLDHGTDFSTFIDGMPVNMRTHGHGQGYTDINFIIPELIRTIDYVKGPYHAELGDFSSAGGAQIQTYKELPQNRLLASVGKDSSAWAGRSQWRCWPGYDIGRNRGQRIRWAVDRH